MTTTYAKLKSGAWGVRADGQVQPGDVVTVEKRDGSTKTETVDRVLWSGPDRFTGEVVSLCSIVPTRRQPRSNWRPCGYPGCSPSFCDECDGAGGGRYGSDRSYDGEG